MVLFFSALIAGLGVGSVYGLIALSYNVVYNSTNIFNVAQGDLMMCGVLVSFLSLNVWHIPQIAALGLVVLVVVALSLIEERIAVRPFLSRLRGGGIGWFISTLGFSLVLETIATKIYGQRTVAAIPSPLGTKSIHVGSVTIAPKYLLAIGVLIAVTALLDVFYKRSWLGNAMRAVAEDRQISALRGVDPNRLSQLAFVAAGLVTAAAAFVVAPIVAANVSVGLTYGLKAFIAMAVGGFGSLRGCVIGGFILGVAEQLFDLYLNSNYEIFAGLVLILFVLAIRPTGLFGLRRVRQV
jgi:branched-chain amino acid transport system permease protein